jgi:hypothetical protein
MVFDPTFKFIAPEVAPDATVVPFTVIVELAPCAAVGVTVILVTAYATLSVYEVVLDANVGASVPWLTVIPEREASDEAGRITVMVYVSVVRPSYAVTKTVIIFEPTFKFIAPDAAPEAVVVPFTVIVELAPCAAVGVIVMLVTAFATLAVYEFVPEENVGASVPWLTVMPERVALGVGGFSVIAPGINVPVNTVLELSRSGAGLKVKFAVVTAEVATVKFIVKRVPLSMAKGRESNQFNEKLLVLVLLFVVGAE